MMKHSLCRRRSHGESGEGLKSRENAGVKVTIRKGHRSGEGKKLSKIDQEMLKLKNRPGKFLSGGPRTSSLERLEPQTAV